MRYFCNGKKGFCDYENECQSTCEFFDGRGGYYAEVVTNADRIRAMSDEELAEYVATYSCPPAAERTRCGGVCPECWLDWLRQPVKDGED